MVRDEEAVGSNPATPTASEQVQASQWVVLVGPRIRLSPQQMQSPCASLVGCCTTCLDARGITDEMLSDGTRRSTLEELANWTLWADQVVTF